MRKQDRITINDKTYAITQLPATEAVKIQLQLMNLIGGDILKLFSDDATLASVFQGIEPEKVLALITQLVESPCVADEMGAPVDINQDFSGNLLDLYELVFCILRSNYEAFFLGFQGRIEKVIGKPKKQKPSKKKR